MASEGAANTAIQAVEKPRPCYSSDFTSITLSARFLSSGADILTDTMKTLSKNYTPSPIYCSSRWTVISLVLSTSASATQTWCFLNWSLHHLFYSTWLYKKRLWGYHCTVMVYWIVMPLYWDVALHWIRARWCAGFIIFQLLLHRIWDQDFTFTFIFLLILKLYCNV